MDQEATHPANDGALLTLQRSDAVPLYTQLKHRLIAAINEGQFKEGGLLPTEAQLCEMFNVSRITVRRAVSELQGEGILEKRHGKGTFVTVQRLETSLMTLDGFSETYSAQGVEHHSHILEIRECPADAQAAKALQLEIGSQLLQVRRLITTRKGPLTLDESQFPSSLYPGLATRLKDDISIYGLLRTEYGKPPAHVRRTISVRLAGQTERQVLACNPGEPLFDMEKVISDQSHVPLQRSRLLTPCNRIVLTIDV
ncbi:GntR family transcriptional regulator [Natronohydrobacter thiooxidans]|uniref:GntR family transcriptional regulator n=1 Tax=Natronohydrobacter thiooxidans TaxID=87172 RepID=UPI0008FF55FF|nr:UTRA domain-containing protein [Natronohydrobacter thiooxidans]